MQPNTVKRKIDMKEADKVVAAPRAAVGETETLQAEASTQ